MTPTRSQRPLHYPTSWEHFAYGEWAKTHIQMRLDEWLPKLFGYHMLKLGGLSCELATHACHIAHQVNVDLSNPLRNIVAENEKLPFFSKVFDACLIANQLDYTDDPHCLLREIDRLMMDDGYLIITGVNPTSVMGLGKMLPWRKSSLPEQMYSPLRVGDWLSVLNYQVIETACFGLWPTEKHWFGGNWLEISASGLAPALGSLYFIVARKRTYPLKPIKPAWQRAKSFVPARANYCLFKPW